MKPLFDLFFSQGWNAVVDKYGSYNVKDYLSEFGISHSMIDYIGLMLGIETNLFTALTSHFRDALLINQSTKFYHIIGGNKRFIDQLSKPCDINYSTIVLSIHRNENQTVNIITKDAMNRTRITNFDRVVVATTAPAARLIRYTPVDNQVKEMSRALRQLHYDCSSKIVLYFNYSWWHDQNISGGSSTTDLPLRFIYYDNYNTTIHGSDHTEAVLLASYTFAQDSTLWSSSTLEQITNEALNNLEEIHSRFDIRNYYLRTIVKHWCIDSFSHGAYALFLPYQEDEIKPILMKSFEKRIFFAGEHLSTAHAWVEGAILSGLRVLMQIQNEKFDIVIIGGGLLGLQTAIDLIHRQPTWNILLLEENSLLKSTCLNQFEPSSTNTTITEYLQFGTNLINGQFNSNDLMDRYQFKNLPNNYQGQINGKLEYVNTTKMIVQLLNILQQDKYINITIRENERFINRFGNQIVTNRRTLTVNHKVLFLDNCYINDYLQQSLQAYRLNIKMEQFPLLSFPSIGPNSLPTWLYNNELLGFDVNDTKSQRKIILFNSNITLGLSWLREHASSILDIDRIEYNSNYTQTTLINQDHIIDYLPNSNNQSILFLGRTHIDLYPMWVKILTNLTLDISSPIATNYSLPISSGFQLNFSFRTTLSIQIFIFYFLLK
jgi:predicted NAD/FAD-dependent oxidoreductase